MTGNKIGIKIREPWWGAWKKFGWKKGVPGVGIRKDIIVKAHQEGKGLLITVGKKEDQYFISPNKALDYVAKRKSIFLARKGTVLYVIPLDLCDPVTKLEPKKN